MPRHPPVLVKASQSHVMHCILRSCVIASIRWNMLKSTWHRRNMLKSTWHHQHMVCHILFYAMLRTSFCLTISPSEASQPVQLACQHEALTFNSCEIENWNCSYIYIYIITQSPIITCFFTCCFLRFFNICSVCKYTPLTESQRNFIGDCSTAARWWMLGQGGAPPVTR